MPGAMEDTKTYPHSLCPCVFTPSEQFQHVISGTADEEHECLERGGHLVGSGGAQMRGGEAEAKFLLSSHDRDAEQDSMQGKYSDNAGC